MISRLRHTSVIILSLCVLIFSAGCASASTSPAAPSGETAPTDVPPVETAPTAAPVETLPTEAPPAAQPQRVAQTTSDSVSSAPLLAWVGKGAAPGQHSASQPGDFALLAADGTFSTLLKLPQGMKRLLPCGVSPDGARRLWYIGGDTGTLYIADGTNPPAPVEDIQGLSCLASDAATFAADGSRLAYIAYEAGAGQSEFADGLLRVLDANTLARVFTADNAVAYTFTADSVAYISFFTNNRGEANEAAISLWNGSAIREIATLKPMGDTCRFVSASLTADAGGVLWALFGHRCRTGEAPSTWQLYRIEAAGTATMVAFDAQRGAFVPYARTNWLFVAPDGVRLYFTVPDGVTARTAAFKVYEPGAAVARSLIEQQAIMPDYGGVDQALPLFSPDRRYLALVVTTPNNQNTLTILDLHNPDSAPVTFSAGDRGSLVTSMAFTPDSRALFVVAGGKGPADNSLWRVDVTSGQNSRVLRGRFGPGLAVLSDGITVALTDWQQPEDTRQPAYLNTVLINTATNEVTTRYTGADLVNGKVENPRFALPLGG